MERINVRYKKIEQRQFLKVSLLLLSPLIVAIEVRNWESERGGYVPLKRSVDEDYKLYD